ncbi:hypothetical protein NUW58_g7980 [Xylaria curta]|uniref:Uncharacterized protein n=1 Tax=Xylaria curta TaxID=42375 RepID=A0ACC1ND19_9PEZI|nr:hypothetical protein NUW58_g7980 [Xylaria curta]
MGGQAAVVRPGSNIATTNPTIVDTENMAGAVSDADAYFAGVGSQQMAAMGIDDGFGGTGTEAGYVVNQFAPQQVLQPAHRIVIILQLDEVHTFMPQEHNRQQDPLV